MKTNMETNKATKSRNRRLLIWMWMTFYLTKTKHHPRNGIRVNRSLSNRILWLPRSRWALRQLLSLTNLAKESSSSSNRWKTSWSQMKSKRFWQVRTVPKRELSVRWSPWHTRSVRKISKPQTQICATCLTINTEWSETMALSWSLQTCSQAPTKAELTTPEKSLNATCETWSDSR